MTEDRVNGLGPEPAQTADGDAGVRRRRRPSQALASLRAGLRRPKLHSVGLRVAMVLALVFLPVAAIMVGVAGLTYRESLYRNETEMLRYLARISELRETQIARSALLAVTLDRLAHEPDVETCDTRLERLSAGDVWRSARFVTSETTLAGAPEPHCDFESRADSTAASAIRVVHALGGGTRVEARLAPIDLLRPVGLERGEVGNFRRGWQAVGAVPPWELQPWPIDQARGPTVFSGTPAGDVRHTYALGARDRYGVASVFAIPSRDLRRAARERLVTTLGLLLTILVLGIVSAWASIEWVVLRRLRAVQGVAGQLAAGDLGARVEAENGAPMELRELGQSINHMARRIERRTREVEGAVAEQRRLLRELHHRVKNNFQVIASLLSLQRRALPEEVGRVLRYPEDHVAAMATAYRISYASGEIDDVALPEFLRQITSHVLRSTGLRASRLEGDVVVEGTRVDLDSAVALGLLLTELLVPVCREAARVEATVRLDVLAGVSGLNVLVSGPAPEVGDHADHQAGLPKRFTTAFLNQIDGEMEVHEESPFYRARVRVPVSRIAFDAEDED